MIFDIFFQSPKLLGLVFLLSAINHSFYVTCSIRSQNSNLEVRLDHCFGVYTHTHPILDSLTWG